MMNTGFLLTKEQKEQKKKVLKMKMKQAINNKKLKRVSKKTRESLLRQMKKEQDEQKEQEKKEQEEKELQRKIKQELDNKKIQRELKKKKESSMRYVTDNSHSSVNIMNCVKNLQRDCRQFPDNTSKVVICQSLEKKHSFLQTKYFHIYRQLCYGDLKDLKLLQRMLDERDLFNNPNNSTTVEDSTKAVGKILTEKYCPDLEQKILDSKK